jgi:glycosyltransferase involved in cell wall biosynthesis
MRIGMILDDVFPPDPRVENEAIELIKEGHEVFLFCLKYNNEKPEEIINGINVRRYKNTTLIYKFSALVFTIPVYSYYMKNRISHFIKNNDIDVLHIHDMRIAEACFWANKKYKLPVVLDLHENRPEIMKFYPYVNSTLGKLLISVQKWKEKEEEFVQKSDYVVVVTKHAKSELLQRANIDSDRIKIVPNTIRKSFYEDIKPVKLDYKKDNFTVLYIGDTGYRRGLKTVVSGLKILKQEKGINDIKFLIIGSVNDNDLVSYVKKNNLEDEIEFLGWQNEITFPSWIKLADICVSPLHKNIHHDTTYANKIFQYMSFGKPILVSDVLAQKELIESVQSGLFHKEQDAIDFADKLLKLYNDENSRIAFGKNGEEFVRSQFTWDKTSNELKQIYTTIN